MGLGPRPESRPPTGRRDRVPTRTVPAPAHGHLTDRQLGLVPTRGDHAGAQPGTIVFRQPSAIHPRVYHKAQALSQNTAKGAIYTRKIPAARDDHVALAPRVTIAINLPMNNTW